MSYFEQPVLPDSEVGLTPPSRSSFRVFLFALLLSAAAVYFATFALVRLAGRGYISSSLSRWGPVLDYPFQVKGLNAKIVIFGDSTAFLGIDPRIVGAELGLQTVVLPNTLGSLPVTSDLALEEYLRQNQRPDLLVLYFAPWNLDYLHHNQQRLYFEGIETLIRNGEWSALGRFTAYHPLDVLAFPMQIQSTLDIRNLKAAMHGGKTGDMQQTFGHRDYTEPWPAVSAACEIPQRYIMQTAQTSVQDLAEKYRRQGYRVVIYLAPIPACSNSGLLTQRPSGDFALKSPATLAASSFAQDDFYGHLWPAAVPAASHLLADTLRNGPFADPGSRRSSAAYPR